MKLYHIIQIVLAHLMPWLSYESTF
jgi:hypothetical protein